MATALRLCPGATVVGVPRRACSEKSRAIVSVLERFTPVVEPASIDEMYLDLTGTEELYRNESLEATARRIRQAVLDETEIAVSIGGGTTRLVAKLAAKRAKPHRSPAAEGVVVVPPGKEAEFLATFDLADIPGVGPRFQDRLRVYGLVTVRDALGHDEAALKNWLGERAAVWLYRRIRGIDPTPVEARERAKSISRDETFAKDLDDDRDLTRELLRLADRAASDLRKHGWAARTITVRIRDRDFRNRSKSLTLDDPVVADRVIAQVARALFAQLRERRRVPARLLGVALSNLKPADEVDQLSLFDEGGEETNRDRALSRAIDQVRERFGYGAVGRGA
ncbi:MAG: DNA polymerase IV [Gemmatimonadota bacterium]|nr:MAG: DNA polymerase IV [Gemmatimonadota bacterium]